MRTTRHLLLCAAALLATTAAAVDNNDPASVVAEWSAQPTEPVLAINFNDETWPDTWKKGSGRECPEWKADATGTVTNEGYVNAVINAPTATGVPYPVLFHNCTFANKNSGGGFAGATAAFCRQFYDGQGATTDNNWLVEGHKKYLEDNIVFDPNTGKPKQGEGAHGEAGFVQFCRNAPLPDAPQTSMHGWMEIDHIPYISVLQWSWSGLSWGRGIKLDYKVGDGEWQPLVWMGSDRHKNGYTRYSDQGYFMENVINASDVSLRWRIWDGERSLDNPVQPNTGLFPLANPLGQMQACRVHKIRIFGTAPTQADADRALNNPCGDVGDITPNIGGGGSSSTGQEEQWQTTLLAFPTARGFGKYTTGGRGGRVVTVTTLADNGDGSLRWAFEQYPGEPLTIVFAVSGNIELQSPLRVQRANWTLAGQTAPVTGIVISRNKVNFGASKNFIVRNMRFRAGSTNAAGEVLEDQALGAENCEHYIFDHCVFGWSVEENMNTADCHFLTVQNSIVHEGLYDAGHKKGVRGYGTQWGGSPATYYRNLLTGNKSRSPRLNGARGEDFLAFVEFANNVNYNYGGKGGCYGGENTANITSYNGKNSAYECNFMNNYYKPGPASSSTECVFANASYARDGATSWAPAKWYVNGNECDGIDSATEDNWTAMEAETYTLDDIKAADRITPEHPYWKYAAVGNKGEYDPALYMLDDSDLAPAGAAYSIVSQQAGTVNRDAIELRLIDEMENGTAQYGNSGIIDKETDAEGFIAYPTDYTVPADTDGDGMPDEWETQNGLDPTAADNNKTNADGYTALEAYLNSLMGEQLQGGFTAIQTVSAGTLAPKPVKRLVRGQIVIGQYNALGQRVR